jgi:hypothetical protein
VRFGGACTATSGGRTIRAQAIVQRSSSSGGSGASAIFVPGFARKFWTITSWTWPCSPWAAAIARSASSRSARVSPIPIRIPVVNGTRASPARRSVSRRAAGSLSGEPKCGPPRRDSRSEVVSSIRPIDAAAGRRRAKSSPVRTPGFRCGSSDVSSRTAVAARARYSIVVEQPSAASSSRATRYRSSGLSPSVNSTSWQPARSPARAISSTSSIVRYARSPRRGGRANVQ